MGEYKLYRGGKIISNAQILPDGGSGSISCPTFQDIDGNDISTFYFYYQSYHYETATWKFDEFKSSGKVKATYTTYDEDDYTCDNLNSNINCDISSTSVTYDGLVAQRTVSVRITNSGTSEEQINCLKEAHSIRITSSTYVWVLFAGYFLDEAITIPAGGQKTITLTLEANNS